ncbi:uncharacterized, partial [Tachysurus ichikawai]
GAYSWIGADNHSRVSLPSPLHLRHSVTAPSLQFT